MAHDKMCSSIQEGQSIAGDVVYAITSVATTLGIVTDKVVDGDLLSVTSKQLIRLTPFTSMLPVPSLCTLADDTEWILWHMNALVFQTLGLVLQGLKTESSVCKRKQNLIFLAWDTMHFILKSCYSFGKTGITLNVVGMRSLCISMRIALSDDVVRSLKDKCRAALI